MDPLREVARQNPWGAGLEVLDTGAVWAWQTLDHAVDGVVRRLLSYGLGPGDLVGMRLAPSLSAFLLLHAVPRLGGIVVPFHPGGTAWEFASQVRTLGRLDLLVVPNGRRDEIARWVMDEHLPVASVEGVGWLDPGPSGSAGLAAHPVDLPRDPEAPEVILLTSGTSGTPRPVLLTHGNLMASAEGVAKRLRLDPADRVLATLALSHVGGLAQLHRNTVVGCTTVLGGTTEEGEPPPFDPVKWLDWAREGGWTHASLVPVMLQRLLEAGPEQVAPRGVRCVLLGGAATPAPLLEQALSLRWPVALTYGMTETTSQVATAPPEQVRLKPGTVGPVLSGVSLRVIDVATGHPCARGAMGELQVRGPTLATVLGPATAATHDGWHATGDLGYLDDAGDLWITGRRSERIITGGTNVDPAEVEAVLLGLDGVREAVVGGVPDPAWGEQVVAWIVLSDPQESVPSAEARLTEGCRSKLAPPRRPRRYVFIDTIPRNPNGKVDRKELRSRLQ